MLSHQLHPGQTYSLTGNVKSLGRPLQEALLFLFWGSVALEVTGDFPERFLNLCAQRQVAFCG